MLYLNYVQNLSLKNDISTFLIWSKSCSEVLCIQWTIDNGKLIPLTFITYFFLAITTLFQFWWRICWSWCHILSLRHMPTMTSIQLSKSCSTWDPAVHRQTIGTTKNSGIWCAGRITIYYTRYRQLYANGGWTVNIKCQLWLTN